MNFQNIQEYLEPGLFPTSLRGFKSFWNHGKTQNTNLEKPFLKSERKCFFRCISLLSNTDCSCKHLHLARCNWGWDSGKFNSWMQQLICEKGCSCQSSVQTGILYFIMSVYCTDYIKYVRTGNYGNVRHLPTEAQWKWKGIQNYWKVLKMSWGRRKLEIGFSYKN